MRSAIIFRMDSGWPVRLDQAVKARRDSFCGEDAAVRLFNGFYEGPPDLVVDRYANTLVIHDYTRDRERGERSVLLAGVQACLLDFLPGITSVVQKARSASDPELRNGVVTYGENPADQISEHGVRYALNLRLNQDTSFYLDTRELRRWLIDHCAEMRVLNLFAYTGSLGVAALAGGAARVVQVDRQRKFLAMARRSAMLNRLDLGRMKLYSRDFFTQVAYYKRNSVTFDCVILDPPFFSTTEKGAVNLVTESVRVVNKVRPLVSDGGYLVVVNNALYLSGAAFMQSLEKLCAEGYLAVEKIVPVPADITGYPHTISTKPPCDPWPFNHPTKIVVLRVKVK